MARPALRIIAIGRPGAAGQGIRICPRVQNLDVHLPGPIREMMDAEAAATPGFRWVSDPIGKRHKLGGSPDFIQPADWPKCPGCAQDMSFVAQIDSVNDEFCFADCGLIYVFYCFDCILSHSEVQIF
jgi:hypothetical protein